MFTVGKSINAFYVQSTPWGPTGGTMKVYIPELLTLTSMGLATNIPVALNKSCYSNASDCKPTVSSTIHTQNYVTSEPSYVPYKQSVYGYGSSLKVLPSSIDCLTCRQYQEEEDNSFNPPY